MLLKWFSIVTCNFIIIKDLRQNKSLDVESFYIVLVSFESENGYLL